jgi:hypothetical protein
MPVLQLRVNKWTITTIKLITKRVINNVFKSNHFVSASELCWNCHIKLKLRVCMFVCNSTRVKPICPKLSVLMLWNQDEILERSDLRKDVLGSSPGQKTKHDSRTSPKLKHSAEIKVVSSARRLWERGHNPETVLGSSPGVRATWHIYSYVWRFEMVILRRLACLVVAVVIVASRVGARRGLSSGL